ncbi:MAG: transposase [Cucumibacter sp.]
MGRSTYSPETIVAKLRLADVLHTQAMSMADVLRPLGVNEVTFYRWCEEYGGMGADQLKRLKQLERENERLRRAVSDLAMDKLNSVDVIHALTDPFILRGPPAFVRSDNRAEFYGPFWHVSSTPQNTSQNSCDEPRCSAAG